MQYTTILSKVMNPQSSNINYRGCLIRVIDADLVRVCYDSFNGVEAAKKHIDGLWSNLAAKNQSKNN